MDDLRVAQYATLVVEIARSSERALAEVYRRNPNVVFAVGCRILDNPMLAEETVQDMLLRVWTRPERYDPVRGSLVRFSV